MKCRLTCEEILELVNHQLYANWGKTCELLEAEEDRIILKSALKRVADCFEEIRSPYFQVDGEANFRVEHSVQYAIFLYFLSNELYRAGKAEKASFVYYLNKLMNAVEWFYAVDLPRHFCAEHPMGTVLGRAVYGDYFFVYQGVTVGGNRQGDKILYPTIGHHVTLLSDSKVIGNCHIGNNVMIAANAYVKDIDIPDNTIVFGQYPNHIIKYGQEEKLAQMEKHLWVG